MFRTSRTLIAVFGSAALVGALAGTAWASPGDPGRFTATPLSPTSVETGMKSPRGCSRQSDPALLRRTDATVIPVMVKLDYDAAASYQGGLPGLPATSPEVTGRPLRSSDANVSKYLAHAARKSSSAAAEIRARVPKAKVTGSYTTVYGGLSVSLPANQAKTLLSLPGVAAVQSDTLNQTTAAGAYVSAAPATAALPADTARFVGATKVWPSLGGPATAGKGVVSRRDRHRRLAREPDARRRRRAARARRPAGRKLRPASSVTEPNRPPRPGVQLQQQADRRVRVPPHLPRRDGSDGRVLQRRDRYVLGPRLGGTRHAHDDHRRRRLRRRRRAALRRRPRARQRHRAGSARSSSTGSA